MKWDKCGWPQRTDLMGHGDWVDIIIKRDVWVLSISN